jgi:hypothetical protein
MVDPSVKITERATISIFDYLGEIGGIIVAFEMIFSFISEPFA